MIFLDIHTRSLLSTEALRAFPDECCGFLLGQEDAQGNKIAASIRPVQNAKPGDKTRRFEIAPLDYLLAEQYATEQGLLLIGIYHSHPNHPSVPSETDRLAAQPYFSYIILSVYGQQVRHIQSWLLNAASQFEEEQIMEYQFT